MKDQRRFKRVPLRLAARYMTAGGEEHQATMINISAGGISLESDQRPEMGTRVIAYIDDIGRVEGRVVRYHDGGFAFEIDAPQSKRERLVERITYHANRADEEIPDDRRHVRVPVDHRAVLALPDGREVECNVLDMSLSGASVETEECPPIGTQVRVGKMPGEVVRHHATGIAVRFTGIQRTGGSLASQLVGGSSVKH